MRAVGVIAATLAVLALHASSAAAQPGVPVGAAPPGASQPPAPGVERHVRDRFTVMAYASEARLAGSLLDAAVGRDTFPGLPRPVQRVTIWLAPDDVRFTEWVGASFPEWGAAAAFPSRFEIVMHGRRAGSAAGNPLVVLRHELAHLALAEALGRLPPRWFDEGYASFAAGEWGREEVLATNLALLVRGPMRFESLEAAFSGGSTRATAAYALAHRAVVELATLDRSRGLSLFFGYWKESQSLDGALRRAYGLTLDGFEDHWRSRTRRRYGALAIAADFTLVAGGILLVLFPLYVARRRRQKLRLQTLRIREEEAARRARESALEDLLSAEGRRGADLLDTPLPPP
jgi:hypothetical protein